MRNFLSSLSLTAFYLAITIYILISFLLVLKIEILQIKIELVNSQISSRQNKSSGQVIELVSCTKLYTELYIQGYPQKIKLQRATTVQNVLSFISYIYGCFRLYCPFSKSLKIILEDQN